LTNKVVSSSRRSFSSNDSTPLLSRASIAIESANSPTEAVASHPTVGKIINGKLNGLLGFERFEGFDGLKGSVGDSKDISTRFKLLAESADAGTGQGKVDSSPIAPDSKD
jgi:hypothetical protein